MGFEFLVSNNTLSTNDDGLLGVAEVLGDLQHQNTVWFKCAVECFSVSGCAVLPRCIWS